MITARPWSLKDRRATNAGADCQRCGIAADLEPDPGAPRRFAYRCPECGDRAALCPLIGGKGCVMPAGHGGRCQSPSGSSWHGEARQA